MNTYKVGLINNEEPPIIRWETVLARTAADACKKAETYLVGFRAYTALSKDEEPQR
jgi:hypothetical protein